MTKIPTWLPPLITAIVSGLAAGYGGQESGRAEREFEAQAVYDNGRLASDTSCADIIVAQAQACAAAMAAK